MIRFVVLINTADMYVYIHDNYVFFSC